VDGNAELAGHTSLSHFVSSDFRASRYYFKQIDMASLFVLGCLLVFWRVPRSSSEAGAKLGITVAAVCAQAWLIVVHNPYVPQQHWKHTVKLYILLLSALSAVLNVVQYFAVAEADQSGSDLRDRVVWGLALITFIAAIGLFVVLFAAFLTNLWRSSIWERQASERAAARATKAASATGGGGKRVGVSAGPRGGAGGGVATASYTLSGGSGGGGSGGGSGGGVHVGAPTVAALAAQLGAPSQRVRRLLVGHDGDGEGGGGGGRGGDEREGAGGWAATHARRPAGGGRGARGGGGDGGDDDGAASDGDGGDADEHAAAAAATAAAAAASPTRGGGGRRPGAVASERTTTRLLRGSFVANPVAPGNTRVTRTGSRPQYVRAARAVASPGGDGSRSRSAARSDGGGSSGGGTVGAPTGAPPPPGAPGGPPPPRRWRR